MEDNKGNEPTVEIRTAMYYEKPDEECINYFAIRFQDSDIYISGSQEFMPLLTDEQGSLIKAAAVKINQHQAPNKDEGRLSTKRKPMSERVKNCTEEELEEIANDRLKELMTTVDLNLVKDKINDRLCIEEQESIEEEKCIIGSPPPPRMSDGGLRIYSIDWPENTDSNWSDEQIHESLLKRRKGQHLNETQNLHVMRLLEGSPESWKFWKTTYKMSRATLRRIMKQMEVNRSASGSPFVQYRDQKSFSESAKQLIRRYLLPPCEPKSIPMLKKHLESKLKESYSTQKIRNYVKKEMKYTYKKGCSRPPIYSTRRTQLVKALFWAELLSFISKGEVIINWDESSFDRSVKKEFSWLPVGKSS